MAIPQADPYAYKLARVQAWLGADKVGVYSGVYTAGWSLDQFAALANNYRVMGVDFAVVKLGEWGNFWHGGDVARIRQQFYNAGVGFAPYFFCRPQTWRADAQNAIAAARICGGVVLDCEEQFIGFANALANLVNTVRAAVPNACIIVSGYGDPAYALGGKWPMWAVRNADAYQPQTYFAYWTSIYRARGAVGSIDWGMSDTAGQFAAQGLGTWFPIQPCIAVPLWNWADYQATGARMRRYIAALVLWESSKVNGPMIQALKAGLRG